MPETAAPRRRQPDTGLIRPTRPCPADFRETYLAMGWDGIEDHYRTNWRVIRRWIVEAGGEELKAARAAVIRAAGPRLLHPDRQRARRYVMGRTLAGAPGRQSITQA